jgi:DNA polymerase IIIc chi subunit
VSKQSGVPISSRVWNSEQSWHCEVLEKLAGRKVKLYVRCNSYDFQSYARSYVWKNDEWSFVHEIPGEHLQTNAPYVQKTGISLGTFHEDLTELRRVTLEVIA